MVLFRLQLCGSQDGSHCIPPIWNRRAAVKRRIASFVEQGPSSEGNTNLPLWHLVPKWDNLLKYVCIQWPGVKCEFGRSSSGTAKWVELYLFSPILPHILPSKSNVIPLHFITACRGSRYVAPLILHLDANGGVWLASRPGRFALQGKESRYSMNRRTGGYQNRTLWRR